MLCKYRFQLAEPLHVAQSIPLWVSKFLIEFVIADGNIIAVTVGVRCIGFASWPRIESSPREGVKALVTLPAPDREDVEDFALTFLALLSLQGIDARWDEQPPFRTWVAETPIEQSQLVVNNYQQTLSRQSSARNRQVPFANLLQTALASRVATPIRGPLEFLQYANERFGSRRFIEAFQYYFFVIESLYCNGLSSPDKVVQRLLQQKVLRVKVRMALKYPRLFVKSEEEKRRYREHVQGLNVQTALTELVKTRGQLHHHNLRSPHAWSLNAQERYLPAATFAANIAFPLLFREARSFLWDKSVLEEFEKIRALHK